MNNWDTSYRTCPYCGSDAEASMANNGLGYEQISPHQCEVCGAREIGPFEKPAAETADEKRTGWREPEPRAHAALRKAHAAGLAEGLEKAASWHEAVAENCRKAMAEAGANAALQDGQFGIKKHRGYAAAIRALMDGEGGQP